MEVKFANCGFARSDEWKVSTTVGNLSLTQAEGEGDGSFTARWRRAYLNPSPQSSPLAIRGEAEWTAKCPYAWETKRSWVIA